MPAAQDPSGRLVVLPVLKKYKDKMSKSHKNGKEKYGRRHS